MLKGKTIIELTNVETGEVERHEDDNIVTNALNKVFEPIGIFKNSGMFLGTEDDVLVSGSILPYYQNLTGGLLLFDKKITEDVNTIYAPAGVTMTGCGAYGMQNETENLYRGNFNVNESEANLKSGTVKYVYDFPTSKGNGTISCACLTSKEGGLCGYGAETVEKLYNSNIMSYKVSPSIYVFPYKTAETYGKEHEFLIDIDNDAVYTYKIDSTTSISITKHRIFLHSLSIFDNPTDTTSEAGETTTIELSTGLLGTEDYGRCVDIENEKLYIGSAEDYSDDGINAESEMVIVTINLQDMSLISEQKIQNKTGETLSAFDYFYVYNNYLYIQSYDWEGDAPCSWYKINLASPTEFTKIEMPKNDDSNLYDYGKPIGVLNGKIYCNGTSSYSNYGQIRHSLIDTVTNKVTYIEVGMITSSSRTGYSYIPVKSRPWLYVADSSDYDSVMNYGTFSMLSNYLATINNLSAPITKTDKQTMKVTYILQKDPPAEE